MSIRPLHDRLVVRRLEAETTSKGGILLPGNAQEKPSQGEVIAVGDGVTLDNGELRPLLLRTGDRVLFGKFSGSEVKLDGETLLIMRESDVLAVIENAGSEEKVA
ncbi:10 kDa chaperonin [Marinobacterium nitratireducens]|uniref:Co-chaperonin GroES n=1 Tax=Marinobacterium nitratireducens TaxID=518897 RepID=A0A918DRA8_9GAMM|nr:co-chaperone GroES [Marinobacterium nitratireducens]GGO80471.1 10 kDa chaperonin [Marinobacterium nitratireducens]